MYTYHRHILVLYLYAYIYIYIFIIHMSESYSHNLLVTHCQAAQHELSQILASNDVSVPREKLRKEPSSHSQQRRCRWGNLHPPYISQFSFYGLLNPSKTSKIIIWPFYSKIIQKKWKIFKNTSKFDKNRGGWFKPGSAECSPAMQPSGLRARCRARKNPRGLDASRRGRGQPPCGLQLQQLRKWRHRKPVMAS